MFRIHNIYYKNVTKKKSTVGWGYILITPPPILLLYDNLHSSVAFTILKFRYNSISVYYKIDYNNINCNIYLPPIFFKRMPVLPLILYVQCRNISYNKVYILF